VTYQPIEHAHPRPFFPAPPAPRIKVSDLKVIFDLCLTTPGTYDITFLDYEQRSYSVLVRYGSAEIGVSLRFKPRDGFSTLLTITSNDVRNWIQKVLDSDTGTGKTVANAYDGLGGILGGPYDVPMRWHLTSPPETGAADVLPELPRREMESGLMDNGLWRSGEESNALEEAKDYDDQMEMDDGVPTSSGSTCTLRDASCVGEEIEHE